MHHTGQTSLALRESSWSRNSKNYFSDVTFNYFYSDSRKIPSIKEQLMYTTLEFPVVLNALRFIVGASPELKFRTTDKAETAHVVSELPTARKP